MFGLASSKSTDQANDTERRSLRTRAASLARVPMAALLLSAGFAASLGVAASPAAASTANGSWTQHLPTNSPPARNDASMAYDAATHQLVLFGGLGDDSLLGDTWTWSGTTWTELFPATSPAARQAASMAYDAATHQLVLFGGFGDDDNLGDTWTWSGTTWTELFPATSPSARGASSMAYDAATNQLVLFGGLGDDPVLGDTWTWSGTTWTELFPATSPSARAGASMAYDPGTDQLLNFGGFGDVSLFGQTWTWNGTTWTELSPATSPSERDFASMAYDASTSQLVLGGGNDTWTWNGTTWDEVSVTSVTPARSNGSMADDPSTGQLVLFGGTAISGLPLGDTWTFSYLPIPKVTVTNSWDTGGREGRTFTATVAGANGLPTPTGRLTWMVERPGGPWAQCSSNTGPIGSSNVATYTCTIERATVAETYLATASYAGDVNYSPASGSDNSATPAATTTALSISRSSVSQGAEDSEVFTTTVTETVNPYPTGTVKINDGSTTLCSTTVFTPKTADAIAATCKLSKLRLAVGSYSVTASYDGSHSFERSASTPVRFRVTKDAATNAPLVLSSGAVVPVASTGEPWSGQLYPWLVGASGVAGFVLLRLGRRRVRSKA